MTLSLPPDPWEKGVTRGGQHPSTTASHQSLTWLDITYTALATTGGLGHDLAGGVRDDLECLQSGVGHGLSSAVLELDVCGPGEPVATVMVVGRSASLAWVTIGEEGRRAAGAC